MAIENMVRKLPFSLEAEQSVLGSILIDPEALNEIATIIGVDDFYLKEHQEIYSAMQKLFLQSRMIDPVTLMDALVQEGVYNSEESKNYIRTIAEIVPYSSNIRDYATIVRDKSLLRQLIAVTGEIAEDAYAEQDSATDIINLAESKVFQIAQTKEQHDFTHIREILLSTYKQIKETADNPEASGTPTGFSGLDNILVGMGKSDMIIVGARPGMGKTSFAMNVAVNVAKQSKKSVCIFSLEMSKEQLVSRVLSSEAQVESGTLRSGMLSQDDWDKLAQASAFLSETEIYIDDTTNITVTGMKSKLRRVKNLGLVVIDYLGLMQSDRRIDNRVQEVTDITRNIKIMAKELMVPVICCAQLNRENTARKDNHRPQLADLRDSGSIEQDADVVLFLHRDDYYNDDSAKQNTAEIIVAKNRHGGTGKVEVGFFGKYTKFTTLDMRDENG